MMLPIITLVGLDQVVKLFSLIMLRTPVTILSGFLDLELAQNTGISFGMFANLDGQMRFYLLIVQVVVVVGLAVYYAIQAKYLSKMAKYGLRLMMAGGIANLIDRLCYGAVVDMLDISFFGIHLFTCNLADLYITLGLIMTATFKHLKRQSPANVKYKLTQEDGL